jgi:hypothetical protein
LAHALQWVASMTTTLKNPFARRTVLGTIAFIAVSIAASNRAHAQLGDLKSASAGYEYYGNAKAKRTSLNPNGSDAAFQTFEASLTAGVSMQPSAAGSLRICRAASRPTTSSSPDN